MERDKIMTETKLYLLGDGEALSAARVIAEKVWPTNMLVTIPLQSPDRFHYAIPDALLEENPASVCVFAALDEAHLSYRRLAFLDILISQGYKMANLISPLARIEEEAKLEGNVLVSAGATVARGVTLGLGAWLDTAAIVTGNATIGKGCTLKPGAIIGEGCNIGFGTIVGMGVVLSAGTIVGQHCELNLRREYPLNIPDRTLFDPLYTDGATIFNL
jgi:carbonic anhydrase/acetyltransferase-like protein (isoleucine patch superfamily)